MLVFVEEGKPEYLAEKNIHGRDENQQQMQPTYGTGPELNLGAMPAPQFIINKSRQTTISEGISI